MGVSPLPWLESQVPWARCPVCMRSLPVHAGFVSKRRKCGCAENGANETCTPMGRFITGVYITLALHVAI